MWLLASAALAQSSSGAATDGFSLQYLDRSVNACSDFYQFACGNWLTTHPLPADRSRFGRIADLADRNDLIVRDILERSAGRRAGRTGNEQKIGDFYASCMDETTRAYRGAAPAMRLMRDIDAIANRTALARMAGRFNRLGLPTLITLSSAPDVHNSSVFIATIGQGAMGLPDRDLYLRDDERSVRLRAAYLAHVQKMFELLGDPADAAARTTAAVMAAETAIAHATFDRVTLRDPRNRDNPMTVEQLATLAPNLDVSAFVRETGAPAFTRVNVINPAYVRSLNEALETLPLSTWKAYMKWRRLSAVAPQLSSPFEDERFRFTGTVLSGQPEMPPRWKRCATAVAGVFGDDQLGEIVGRIFVQEHFGAQAKARMDELIDALEHSLQGTIEQLAWMGPETKARALEKLRAISHKIGATERWRDFSGVTITRTNYVANAASVSEDTARRQLRWIGQPVDRSLWLMTPQTVNAYYMPQLNEIVFPAGILQPPFFDPTLDEAVNFGAIGAVIGHELSHGFDDHGRTYDGRGNLADWWTPQDDASFRERAACLSTQYSAFATIGDTRLNGELTLSENVADNAGVRIAYYALMEVLEKEPPPAVGGFTAEQRFFLAWGQTWCENATEQDFTRRAQEDTHSSGRWRTNGVLRNSAEFRKAFGCAPGTPMAPETVCRVW